MSNRIRIATIVLAALWVGLGCQGTKVAPEPPGPILVLGIDGAEWNVMEPMLERGELPHFAELIERGASGRLRSLDPRQGSPVIWTTIATGRPPQAHGVGDFLADGGLVPEFHNSPFSSNMWRSNAFWDILGNAGLTVGVVAWYVTWPAWEVNGFMVSNYIQRFGRFDPGWEEESITYPGDLGQRVEQFVRTPESVTDEDFFRFLSPPDASSRAALEGRNESILRDALSGDETALGVALSLVSEDVPDLTCIYVRGVDLVCHRFWMYMDPETRPTY